MSRKKWCLFIQNTKPQTQVLFCWLWCSVQKILFLLILVSLLEIGLLRALHDYFFWNSSYSLQSTAYFIWVTEEALPLLHFIAEHGIIWQSISLVSLGHLLLSVLQTSVPWGSLRRVRNRESLDHQELNPQCVVSTVADVRHGAVRAGMMAASTIWGTASAA